MCSNRHSGHATTAAGPLFQIFHHHVPLSDMVESPGSALIQAVQRNWLQGGLHIVSWEHRVSLQSACVGFPPLPVRRTQAELKHSLKPSSEILIEETINNGVDAAVEEGKPVGKWVYVNVDYSVLLLSQAGIVTQHHESPQRQPGKDEKQSNYQKHLYHPLLFL